jgi:pimeloyl-ACP methyl ester carboxylesterase
VLKALGNGTIFAEPAGPEPVRVVYLHGWGRSGADFAAVGHELAARGVGSLALDLPGFGASPAPVLAGGARHYAALLVPVLEEIGGPLVLVGHSFGGRVATVIAATHPALVSGVVLTGAPLLRRGGGARSPRAYAMIRQLHRRGLVSDARMERARQRYGSADYRQASGVMRDVLVASVNESYDDELRTLVAPVSLVWGENDTAVPLAIAREAQAMIGNGATLECVAGVGHLLPTQRPGALVAAISAMVSA